MTQLGLQEAVAGKRKFTKLLFRLAWIFQALLWLLFAFLIGHYWLVEVKNTNKYYEAGLVQGFEGLAGIVASIEPNFDNVKKIVGTDSGSRLSRLQGETHFRVWLGRDEFPSWNSGAATLAFDQKGKLLWVKRYLSFEHSQHMYDPTTNTRFPVVLPRLKAPNSSSLIQPQTTPLAMRAK